MRSTARRCEAAWKRIRRLTERYGLPRWRTVAEAEAGVQRLVPGRHVTYYQTMKTHDWDALRADIRALNTHLGPVPWGEEEDG